MEAVGNAVHVFILALTGISAHLRLAFSSIYLLLWLPWYILYFKPVSVGGGHSLWEEKGKVFQSLISLLFSKYGNFAYVKFPSPPFSFYVWCSSVWKRIFPSNFCVWI